MYNTARRETIFPDHELELLLTLNEAAKVLGVHRGTILSLMRRGELPATKIGGQWRIKPSSLKRLIDRAEDGAK